LELAGSATPKAVLLGGAAGAFVGTELLDLKLTHEDTRAAGVTLGSGDVIVYAEQAELVPSLLRIGYFFRHASSARCVASRLGHPRCLPPAGHRHANALLRRHADTGERVPRLRGRARGRADARALLFAQGGGRHGGAHRFRARAHEPQARARAARLVGRPFTR